MTFTALILHGYSSKNRGDGLLVEETVDLVREALGKDTAITLLASDPDSFRDLPVSLHCTRPSRTGWRLSYLRQLVHLNRYDLVVGVGGGYLRAGTLTETLKCALVMGPQLLAAAVTTTPTLYLPQSIGPLRGGTRHVYRPLLRRLTQVMLRDDRSVEELRLPNAVRTSDLAVSSPEFTSRVGGEQRRYRPDTSGTVVSVRTVNGAVPPSVLALATALRENGIPFVGYVQSAVGGNNDVDAQHAVTPDSLLTEDQYLRQGEFTDTDPRVVVAVRLHAALLAVRAGHRVIHLAYERKGFSAFADLGLAEWVHNVNDCDTGLVLDQITALRDDPAEQRRYDDSLRSRLPFLRERHDRVVGALRSAVDIH